MDAVRGSTPTRVNFLDAAVADAANDRSFARFFKQKSVKELENVVRQKLGLDEGVNVELHHLCYDHSLALNDKDDFDMLRHYAATSDVVKISFVLREELEDALPRKRRRLNPAPPAAPDQIIEPAPENDASENTPNIETTKPKKSKVATQVPTDNVVVALPNRSTENKRKRVEPPASPEPVPVAEESIKSLKKRKKAKKKHGAVEHTNDMSDIARAINAASTANNAAEADDAEEEQPKKRKRTKKAKEDESAHVKEVVQPEPEPVVAKPAARPSNGRRKSQASSETLDAVRAFLMNGIAETPAAPSADTTTTPKKTKTKVPTKPLPVDDTRPGNSSKLSAVLGDAKRKEKEDAAEAQERGSAAKPRGRPKKKTEEPSVAAEPKGKGKKVKAPPPQDEAAESDAAPVVGPSTRSRSRISSAKQAPPGAENEEGEVAPLTKEKRKREKKKKVSREKQAEEEEEVEVDIEGDVEMEGPDEDAIEEPSAPEPQSKSSSQTAQSQAASRPASTSDSDDDDEPPVPKSKVKPAPKLTNTPVSARAQYLPRKSLNLDKVFAMAEQEDDEDEGEDLEEDEDERPSRRNRGKGRAFSPDSDVVVDDDSDAEPIQTASPIISEPIQPSNELVPDTPDPIVSPSPPPATSSQKASVVTPAASKIIHRMKPKSVPRVPVPSSPPPATSTQIAPVVTPVASKIIHRMKPKSVPRVPVPSSPVPDVPLDLDSQTGQDGWTSLKTSVSDAGPDDSASVQAEEDELAPSSPRNEPPSVREETPSEQGEQKDETEQVEVEVEKEFEDETQQQENENTQERPPLFIPSETQVRFSQYHPGLDEEDEEVASEKEVEGEKASAVGAENPEEQELGNADQEVAQEPDREEAEKDDEKDDEGQDEDEDEEEEENEVMETVRPIRPARYRRFSEIMNSPDKRQTRAGARQSQQSQSQPLPTAKQHRDVWGKLKDMKDSSSEESSDEEEELGRGKRKTSAKSHIPKARVAGGRTPRK